MCKLISICPHKINNIFCVCKILSICPRKSNIIYLRGQIDNNLHTQKILFILRVHIISYLPMQINNRKKLFAHAKMNNNKVACAHLLLFAHAIIILIFWYLYYLLLFKFNKNKNSCTFVCKHRHLMSVIGAIFCQLKIKSLLNDSLLCEPRDSSYWNSRMLYIGQRSFGERPIPVTHMEPSVVL